MNPERLLALYERVADASDAIPRLRRFVLDLAVRGKLVAQDPNDEPASELLKRIAAEKARLVEAGDIRKLKPPVSINPDEAPFDLPRAWRWVRLADILTKLTDGTHHSPPNGPEGEFLYITAKNIKDDGVKLHNATYVSRKVHEEIYARCNPEPGDVLYIKDGATTGVVTVNNLDQPFSMLSSVALLKLPPCLFNQLVAAFLRSPFFYEQMRRLMKGAAITRVTLKRMGPALLPLPPLAEQRRIVAKVDELMALLDRFEAARTAREATRDRLTVVSLAPLTAPDTTPEVFPTHARFALDALPALATRPDQIKSLRQTILNLAVRGKLVEQDPNDEPAAELLKRISVEKARLIKSGEIGKDKPLTPLGVHEMPFELPGGWNWCRLGALVLSSDAGWSPRTENQPREGEAWGVLKVSAVSWDRFDPGANKQVLPGAEPRLQAQVHEGDFLISRANTAELVARAVLVTEEPLNLMMSDKIVRLRLAPAFDHSFAWLVNNYGDYARAYYAENATGVSPSMKNVSRAAILHLPFPLPPLAEQHRIVAKVDELMALCTRLETGLNTTETAKQRLLEALLREALEPSLKQAA